MGPSSIPIETSEPSGSAFAAHRVVPGVGLAAILLTIVLMWATADPRRTVGLGLWSGPVLHGPRVPLTALHVLALVGVAQAVVFGTSLAAGRVVSRTVRRVVLSAGVLLIVLEAWLLLGWSESTYLVEFLPVQDLPAEVGRE